MAETVALGCDDRNKWHWYNVMSDLKKQGGLAGVVIDPLSVVPNGCGGYTKKGTRFFISWVPNTLLLVSMSKKEQALVDAFAKVVEYSPFCRYVDERGTLTFEWDKENPEGRFVELQGQGVRELQRI